MSTKRYTPEFKDEAVRQVVDRGYPVAEVADGLSVSAHSLHKWVKAVKPDKTDQQSTDLIEAKSEILNLRAQLRRVEEERDILKKARGTLPGSSNKVPFYQRAPPCAWGCSTVSNTWGSEVGERCGKHRIARLMKTQKIKAIRGYKTPKHPGGRPSLIAPDKLQRAFTVHQADAA
jgi:transposase-like protein